MIPSLLLLRPRLAIAAAFVAALSFEAAAGFACADTFLGDNGSDLDEAAFFLPDRPAKPKGREQGTGNREQKNAPIQKPNDPTTQRPKDPNDEITVTRFRKLKWSPTTGSFASDGSVRIEYNNLETNVISQMTANNVNYDAATGQVQAKGEVRLLRPDGVFTGREIDFNLKSNVGYITDAFLDTDFFRMRGERIERKEDGTVELLKGVFTTCENENPDYRVRAGRLTVKPNQFVSARNITFYAGKTGLISLPSYRRNLRASSRPAIPNVGFNRTDGLTFRQSDTLIEAPHESLFYDARINFRRLPAGFVTYQKDVGFRSPNAVPPLGVVNIVNDPLRGFLEQLTPPTYQEFAQNRYNESNEPRQTFFAVAQNDLFSYTRRRTDLLVSRLPEVGMRWTNLLGKRLSVDDRERRNERLRDGTQAILRRDPSAPFLVDFIASAGIFNEKPTNATAGRLGMRLDVASQPILVSRNLALRAALSNQTALYSRGTVYNLFSPEVELNYVPDRNALFGVGYRFAESIGRTPFAFDARDIRHELRLRA
ncbi:hypothetical protein LC607_35820, partial [Nostoc sp. CHAB 5824]|nr:hypothetical protein [Nostoc sp. CHAB 5824]